MRSINPFRGWHLPVDIEGQQIATKAQRALIKAAFADGKDVPNTVLFGCRVALDVNAAIANGIRVNGKWYSPNPKVRAQFGKNRKGLPYLTFGLVEKTTGTPLTLTWEGDALPLDLIKLAVKHDEGRNVSGKTISLNLGAATIYETGAKHGRRRNDSRRNHDTGPDGRPYPRAARPNHNRMCSADLAKYLRQGTWS